MDIKISDQGVPYIESKDGSKVDGINLVNHLLINLSMQQNAIIKGISGAVDTITKLMIQLQIKGR